MRFIAFFHMSHEICQCRMIARMHDICERHICDQFTHAIHSQLTQESIIGKNDIKTINDGRGC